MKKEILFIHHAKGLGGAPISLLYLLKNLNVEKYKCRVLFLKNSEIIEIFRQAGIEVELINSKFYNHYYRYWNHSFASRIKFFHVFRIIKILMSWLFSAYYFAPKYLKTSTATIIHVNSSSLSDWVYAGRKRNLKTIMHVREPIYKKGIDLQYSLLHRILKRNLDHAIAISKDNAQRINLPDKTIVIYNYINKNEFCKTPISVAKKKKILYVGGASVIKGFIPTVKALKYLDDNISILFVGNYPQTIRKYKLILSRNRKLSTHLNILRNAPNAEEIGPVKSILPFFKETTCLISPFTVPHFSRPIIEAFANSRPSVGTKVEGMDEIIENHVNGLLVDTNDPKQLASAVNMICSDLNFANDLGTKGYKTAKIRYSSENIKQIENLYNRI